MTTTSLGEDDFGFSLVSESELKSYEEQLKQQVQQQTQTLSETEQAYSDKLEGLRQMIMPLLLNLTKDPEKEYILWPDRAKKMNAFIEKINQYVYD